MKFFAYIALLAVSASALSASGRDASTVALSARAPKGGGGGGGRGSGGGGGSSSGGKGGGSTDSGSVRLKLAMVAPAHGRALKAVVRARVVEVRSGTLISHCRGSSGLLLSGGKGGAPAGHGLGSSSSSTGGRTAGGSGVGPRVGGFYGGGAAVPYQAGRRSASGISPLLIGAGLGLGFGALWAHAAFYNYPYTHPFIFHNATTNQNQTSPVNCLCIVNEECGCDDNSNGTYVEGLIGNGSYKALNQSLVTVADVNGTSTIVINGTLPNGTTAAGGTVKASGASSATSFGGYLALFTLIGAGLALL